MLAERSEGMSFSDALKLYLNKTKSTAKELSEASGISASALSRYRSGKRIPDQEHIEKLICGFVQLASENAPEIDELTIRNAFSEFSERPKLDYNAIIKNLNTAIETLDINVSGLARALSFDSSYLSRIRTGQRKPADLDKFIIETAEYIARTKPPSAVAGLIRQSAEELVPTDRCASKLCSWLVSSGAGLCGRGSRPACVPAAAGVDRVFCSCGPPFSLACSVSKVLVHR